MAISYFAYAVSGDSTADGDMIRMLVDPDDLPAYNPYGQEFKAAGGQPMYAGASYFTLKWTAIPYELDWDGTIATSGSVKTFYADWVRARDSHKQRFTCNLFDPTTNTWSKKKCVILWPDWSGKENGKAFVNFEITLTAIGVDFDTASAWGEPNPVAASTETAGDDLVGAAGYGLAGRGLVGYGSDS